MSNNDIIIKVSKNINITDAVCEAMNPHQKECKQQNLHQSIKPSITQENMALKNGESVYTIGEWRSQIAVMLG